MASELTSLSAELAAVTARVGQAVVAVHARPRFSSSGVLWRDGIVVTAEHTVRRQEDLAVTLPDGRSAAATLAGSDAGTDLAVLKVESVASPPLVRAPEPAPGHFALSIGRSENSGVNATLGIVSAVSGPWRTWRGGRLDRYLRLDLTLYPGSAGGLIVNSEGQALGIASGILSRIAPLAIPTATVDRVVEEILARGHVARGYLGVGLQPVELPDHRKGLVVVSLGEDSPAVRAGVLIGDVLVSLNGTELADAEDLQRVLETHAIGQSLEAVVLRGGEARKLAVTIGERPRRH